MWVQFWWSASEIALEVTFPQHTSDMNFWNYSARAYVKDHVALTWHESLEERTASDNFLLLIVWEGCCSWEHNVFSICNPLEQKALSASSIDSAFSVGLSSPIECKNQNQNPYVRRVRENQKVKFNFCLLIHQKTKGLSIYLGNKLC